MNTEGKSAWAGYRKWSKLFFLWILVSIVLVVLCRGNVGAVILLFFLPLLIGIMLLQGFKCPRCGNAFFHGRTYRPDAKKCVHCGLPKWSDPESKNSESCSEVSRSKS